MAWRDFIQFFIPDPFGNMMNDQKYWQNQSWLKTIYLGIVPFCLSTILFFDGRPEALAVCASDGHFPYFCIGR